MVDYQSHYRLHPLGFTSDPPRVPVKSHRELYREEGRKLFRERHDRPVHDCRHEVMKDHTDRREFETWVLSHGVTETYRAVDDLHDKSSVESSSSGSSKKPDKLLVALGETGSAPGDFHYPRGVCTTMDCDILVADSLNHRIQLINQMGVYKRQLGKQGSGQEEFNEPCDVAEMFNGDIAVADRKNKRVQLFTEDFQFKVSLPIPGEPFSLGCDRDMNLAIATTRKEVIIYNVYDEEFVTKFPVGSKGKRSQVPVQISMSSDSDICVSDPEDGHIYLYTLQGKCYARFMPGSHVQGLSLTPGDAIFTPLGQILIVDTLNHVINLYTDRGEFLQQVLVPTDDLGSVHSVAMGLEGHMVVTELSVGGGHCLKIFRYRQCPCHEGKLPTSKKRTPVQSPM